MGKVGFMLLGGAIAIVGLGVLILITMFASWIQAKVIMHKINKENNLNRKLEKAKELLKRYVKIYANPYPEEEIELKNEAEQFLQEVSE